MQLQDAYAVFFQRELWLVGLNISAYSHSGTAFAHDNDRRRKLLAHRHQLENWSSRVDREGLAIIPLALYFKDGRAKISMGSPEARSTIVAKTSPKATPTSTPERRCLANRRSSRQVQLAAVTALLGEARQQCDSAPGAGGTRMA